MKIQFLLAVVLGLLIRLVNTAPSGLVLTGPEEVDRDNNNNVTARPSSLNKRYLRQRVVVYPEKDCTGNPILNRTGFGCGGSCLPMAGGKGVSIDEDPDVKGDSFGLHVTTDLFHNTDCSGKKLHLGRRYGTDQLYKCYDLTKKKGEFLGIVLYYGC